MMPDIYIRCLSLIQSNGSEKVDMTPEVASAVDELLSSREQDVNDAVSRTFSTRTVVCK